MRPSQRDTDTFFFREIKRKDGLEVCNTQKAIRFQSELSVGFLSFSPGSKYRAVLSQWGYLHPIVSPWPWAQTACARGTRTGGVSAPSYTEAYHKVGFPSSTGGLFKLPVIGGALPVDRYSIGAIMRWSKTCPPRPDHIRGKTNIKWLTYINFISISLLPPRNEIKR